MAKEFNLMDVLAKAEPATITVSLPLDGSVARRIQELKAIIEMEDESGVKPARGLGEKDPRVEVKELSAKAEENALKVTLKALPAQVIQDVEDQVIRDYYVKKRRGDNDVLDASIDAEFLDRKYVLWLSNAITRVEHTPTGNVIDRVSHDEVKTMWCQLPEYSWYQLRMSFDLVRGAGASLAAEMTDAAFRRHQDQFAPELLGDAPVEAGEGTEDTSNPVD